MNLDPTEEQEAVRQAFAKLFEKESPIARVRLAEEQGGFDGELWRTLVATGVPTMGVAADLGGGGADLVDLALVAREAGRRLAPVPVVEAAVATRLLSGTAAGVDLIEDIAKGEAVPTIAVRPVTGTVAELVPNGSAADLVVTHHDGNLVAIKDGPRTHTPNLAGLPMADWSVDGADGERIVLASGAAANRAYGRAVCEWKVLTAAYLVGIQQEAQRIGVDYVSSRKVFGTQLGWFQAVQHRLADVATAARGAELLALEAAWAQAEDPERAALLAEMALLFCADTAFRTCRESLQFHGGYGYTLEYDIQLYFRRTKALALTAGPSRHRFQSLAAHVASAAGEG